MELILYSFSMQIICIVGTCILYFLMGLIFFIEYCLPGDKTNVTPNKKSDFTVYNVHVYNMVFQTTLVWYLTPNIDESIFRLCFNHKVYLSYISR